MAPEIILRNYQPGDREFLFQVFAVAGPGSDLHHLPDSPLRTMLIEQQFLGWMQTYKEQFGVHGLQIIECPLGTAIGYIWLFRNEQERRISDLAFLPQAQGKGIGSTLVKRIAAETFAEGLPLRASVAKNNEGSLRFNLRLGYVVTHESATHWAIEWRQTNGPAARIENLS